MSTKALWGLWVLKTTIGLPLGAVILYAIGMPFLNYLKAINLIGGQR